jgi:hypothetical protein
MAQAKSPSAFSGVRVQGKVHYLMQSEGLLEQCALLAVEHARIVLALCSFRQL